MKIILAWSLWYAAVCGLSLQYSLYCNRYYQLYTSMSKKPYILHEQKKVLSRIIFG